MGQWANAVGNLKLKEYIILAKIPSSKNYYQHDRWKVEKCHDVTRKAIL